MRLQNSPAPKYEASGTIYDVFHLIDQHQPSSDSITAIKMAPIDTR